MKYKMTIYGENIETNSTVATEKTDFLSFIYLHGKLEDLNKYDLVESADKLPVEDGYYLVKVILHDGSEHDAWLFVWHSASQLSLWERYPRDPTPMPTSNSLSQQRGLICAVDDVEAIEYAIKKFNARSESCSGVA